VELANNDGEKSPPRKWLTPEDVDTITGKFACVDVLRKGKLLCMVLQRVESKSDKNASMKSESKTRSSSTKYLFLHMGMTGRIAAPGVACKFAEGPSNDGSVFPPPYTYLLLRSGSHQVAFADSRKFGSALLRDSTAEMDALAPDALHTLLGVSSSSSSQQQRLVAAAILPKLAGQSTAIKPLLMDQKRAMSGVGNWVADEVLYQCEMHPDQTHLTVEQAASLCDKLRDILSTAVDRLKDDLDFPEEWLFHYRWTKKKASKDHMGRPLAFIVRGSLADGVPVREADHLWI
jgi:formamidopyrimidine-DNA glycosylase